MEYEQMHESAEPNHQWYAVIHGRLPGKIVYYVKIN